MRETRRTKFDRQLFNPKDLKEYIDYLPEDNNQRELLQRYYDLIDDVLTELDINYPEDRINTNKPIELLIELLDELPTDLQRAFYIKYVFSPEEKETYGKFLNLTFEYRTANKESKEVERKNVLELFYQSEGI